MKRFLPFIFAIRLFSCVGKLQFNLISPDSCKTVSSESVIKIKMAPGGGHSMWIRPLDK